VVKRVGLKNQPMSRSFGGRSGHAGRGAVADEHVTGAKVLLFFQPRDPAQGRLIFPPLMSDKDDEVPSAPYETDITSTQEGPCALPKT